MQASNTIVFSVSSRWVCCGVNRSRGPSAIHFSLRCVSAVVIVSWLARAATDQFVGSGKVYGWKCMDLFWFVVLVPILARFWNCFPHIDCRVLLFRNPVQCGLWWLWMASAWEIDTLPYNCPELSVFLSSRGGQWSTIALWAIVQTAGMLRDL